MSIALYSKNHYMGRKKKVLALINMNMPPIKVQWRKAN